MDSPIPFLLPTFAPRFTVVRSIEGSFGYLAFAHDLIATIRPRLIVELGTSPGESYFTFCQSVFENGLNCVCYSVHTGEDNEANQYNETHYQAFSHLLRAEVDAALSQFAEESIDLLHINGFISYTAVKEAFQAWRLKLRPGGIVLLPEIAVREADFGIWQLWEEIAAESAQAFAFHEGQGLGVLHIPVKNVEPPPLLRHLFAGSASEQEMIRRYYTFYNSYLASRLRPEAASRTQETLFLELKAAQAERMLLLAELKEAIVERSEARRELYQMEQDMKAAKAYSSQLETDVKNWRGMVDYERNIREQILSSLSWKLTVPLRWGIAWIRKLRG